MGREKAEASVDPIKLKSNIPVVHELLPRDVHGPRDTHSVTLCDRPIQFAMEVDTSLPLVNCCALARGDPASRRSEDQGAPADSWVRHGQPSAKP